MSSGSRSGAICVTVGLPFFNARRTLEGAIRSVFAQTFPHWELLLVDDGSTDGSLEIARSVRDPRVRVFSDGKNRQLATRLNEIATEARAPLLARMDADDLMHPERLALQAAFMETHQELDLLGSAAIIIDAEGRPQSLRGDGPLPRRMQEVFDRGLFLHPTVMMRSSWARANPYSLEYLRAEDFELWVRVHGTARVACLPDPLLFYRESVPVDVCSYAATQRSKRAILWRGGPASMGLRATARRVVATYIKEWAYRIAGWIGVQELLLSRRSRQLSSCQSSRACAAIARISSTPVPGLDPAGCLHTAGRTILPWQGTGAP